MYARVARSKLPPATIERLTDDLRERAVPEVAHAEGFLSGVWLADLEAAEGLALVLLDSDAQKVRLGADVERWDVLAFAGRLGGEWCLVHDLAGDALPSVLQSAVDRATASSGNVGAVGLVSGDGTKGVVYAFSEQRPPDGQGGRLYRVLASA